MPGGGSIKIVTTFRAQPAPGFVELEISDTGVGMSEEILPHIFEPFFTTKPPGKGTGLGLSTAYGIVEQNGGSIAVQSMPGQGSRFTIAIPRATDNMVFVSEATRAFKGGAESLLVVEDDPIVRAVTAQMLREAGYTVREAENGHEGLVILQEKGFEFDLVVSDLVMPQMGGLQLADAVWGHSPEKRVLFISGYPEKTPGDQVASPARSQFLCKPFTRAELLTKVREILDGRSGPAAVEEKVVPQ
jgi:CheY-like chemotaxis protein